MGITFETEPEISDDDTAEVVAIDNETRLFDWLPNHTFLMISDLVDQKLISTQATYKNQLGETILISSNNEILPFTSKSWSPTLLGNSPHASNVKPVNESAFALSKPFEIVLSNSISQEQRDIISNIDSKTLLVTVMHFLKNSAEQ